MAQDDDWQSNKEESLDLQVSSPKTEDILMNWPSSFNNHSQSRRITKEGMEELLQSILFGGLEAKVQAAMEIRRLTKRSSRTRSYLAQAGVIQPLVNMLHYNDFQAKEASLLALLNLAVGNERNKVRIVKAGALVPLLNLLEGDNTSLRESAAAVILTLSASAINKPIIGSCGVIPPLVEVLKTGTLQGKVDAVMALCNLASCQENKQPVLDSGALPPLIRILKDCKKSSKFAEKTIALLESLLSLEQGKIAVAEEEGGILALVEAIEEGSHQSKEHALGALLNLCLTNTNAPDYRQAILREGVIPGLLELTVQGTPKAQQRAKTILQLLRDFSSSPLSPSRSSTPDMLESIVSDIAAHVDGMDKGCSTAKEMLAEMVQMSMERSMKQLQRRALLAPPPTATKQAAQ